MKSFLTLAAALAFTATAALAQTVAPGTAPGAQTGNPSNMPSAGDPTTDQQAPNGKRMDRMRDGNRTGGPRHLHKGKKMKQSEDGMKMKTKM